MASVNASMNLDISAVECGHRMIEDDLHVTIPVGGIRSWSISVYHVELILTGKGGESRSLHTVSHLTNAV